MLRNKVHLRYTVAIQQHDVVTMRGRNTQISNLRRRKAYIWMPHVLHRDPSV